MKSKDIFSLAVRSLGLVFLYRGLSQMPQVIGVILSGGIGNFIMGFLMVAWPLVVAYWLLRGAPLLMHIAYPDAGRHSESEQQMFGASEKKADAERLLSPDGRQAK